MGIDINSELLAIMLLYSLPPSFENFRCAIEFSACDEFPSSKVLRIKIVEENDAVQNAIFAKKRGKLSKKGQTGNQGGI